MTWLMTKTRYACGIPDGEQFIVTGGISGGRNIDNVHVYDTNGWVRDLPSLNFGRSDHACASFMTNGERVWNYFVSTLSVGQMICHTILTALQFLLVTGGWSSFYSSISDETEIFTEAQASWRILSARLPVPVYVPKAVSIDNKVLLFGKNMRVGRGFQD